MLRKTPGGAVEVTVDGAGLDQHLVRVDADGDRFYYHQDRMGSVYLITGAGGKPVESYDYTAYGEMRTFDPSGQPIAVSAIVSRWARISAARGPMRLCSAGASLAADGARGPSHRPGHAGGPRVR